MNIDIEFRKAILSDNPEVTVRFGNVKNTFKLISERQTVSLTDIKHDKDTQLIIERHQDDILYSNKTHHSNNIFELLADTKILKIDIFVKHVPVKLGQ